MKFAAIRILFVSIILCLEILGQNPVKIGNGSISGKVTIEGQPASNLYVILKAGQYTNPSESTPPPKTQTDATGIYHFDRLSAGQYRLEVSAPGFVNKQEKSEWQRGILITVGENEALEKIDFNLIRGGVVTGKLIDDSGRSVTEQNINLTRIGDDGKKTEVRCDDASDDRGIYRCYGLEPGKYIVSAGQDDKQASFGFGNNVRYKKTWHPNVVNESQAKIIEVIASKEIAEIDIRLTRLKKTYVATGRVINEDTGEPVKGVGIGYGTMDPEGKQLMGMGFGGSFSNADGEFKIEGLSAGKYVAMGLSVTGPSDNYNKPVKFEITDGDVSDIEIKQKKGSSLSGVAVLEGVDDPNIKSKLNGLQIHTQVINDKKGEVEDFYWGNNSSNIAGDGSILIKGLRPGKVQLFLGNMGSPELKGFSLLRTERDGAPVNDGIEVHAGENVTGVRVVITYASGAIRGLVKFENGTPPEDATFSVTLKRSGQQQSTKSAQVDDRGHFVFEGLSSGDYEVSLSGYRNKTPYGPIKLPDNKQSVTVTNNVEANVTLTVDLSRKEQQ